MNTQQPLSLALPPAEILSPSLPGPASRTSGGSYAELKRRVKSKGLLEKQPVYYTYRIALLFSACRNRSTPVRTHLLGPGPQCHLPRDCLYSDWFTKP